MTEKRERLIRCKEVEQRVGLKRATIYRKMKEGKFPRSIALDGKNKAWIESEIDQWIDDRIKQRN